MRETKRKRKKQTDAAVGRLLVEIEDSYSLGEGKTWSINDLVRITYDNDYITEKRKKQTYRIVSIVRSIMREKHGIEFYSIPGKGYKILNEQEDFEDVFNKVFKDGSSRFQTLERLYKKGELHTLALHAIDSGRLEQAKQIINFLEGQTINQKQYESVII